ncbi:sterol 3-beta-glucosyltransferase [Sporobolomyces salmoneus]|uniref:sterol 3-beta-glucosyltransferase n=1 Tax=Sporobolomyces salmoneus TaxID=183962 RepID=UPI00317695CC
MAPDPSQKPTPIDTSVQDDKTDSNSPKETEEEESPHKAPADTAKFDSPNDYNHPPDLSGWGIAGERYGGMAQARLRDSDTDAKAAQVEAEHSREASIRARSDYSDDDDDSSSTDGYSVASRNDEEELSKDERHEVEDETRERELFESGGTRSYHGGMNQGMLHALAREDPDRTARSEDHIESIKRAMPSKFPSQQSLSKSQARSETSSPMPATGSSSSSVRAQDHVESPKRPLETEEADRSDSSDAGPSMSQFISPRSATQSPSSKTKSEGLPQLGDEVSSTAMTEDLSKSSILAIHRPIAARRRTESGLPGEVQGEDGMYMSQTSEGEIAEEGQVPNEADEIVAEAKQRPLPPSRTSTARTEKSMGRRLKLAEKLMDVFGLEEVEDVVAEFPCWLFRSVLLQGYLYLTTGHVCFYAYLSQREGTVVRSGSLSVRSKARRYNKHWFILKDSILSWYPSSTDPYFPDGHVDLHYCISVEPSSFNRHHFKVTTNQKRWHFSADSEASRDEWVKTIKKVVFRCQNEGESVKIAIPLETIIDIERSQSLEFAETIRLRVYDADEGYSIDEYWLSYFKDMDVALEKLNLVLDTFRKLRQDRETTRVSMDQDIEDTTRRAVADIDDPADQHKNYRKDKKDNKANRRSLTDKMSSMFISEPSETPQTESNKSSARSSTLASKLNPFSSSSASSAPATPPSGSVATLRPPAQDDSDSVSIAPPPIGQSSQPSSSETLPASANAHTYPPEPSSSSGVSEPPRRTSTLGKIFSASSTGSRKILEVVTHSNLPGGKSAKAKTASEKRPDTNKVVFDETLVEEPETTQEEDSSNKTAVEFRKMFGLSEKEELLEQYPAYLYRGLPISGRVYLSTNYFCFRSSGILAVRTKMLLPISDILDASKHRSYRIGFSGLMVVIRGHEEVFLELNSNDRRDECLDKLTARLELARQKRKNDKGDEESVEHRELQSLLDLSGSAVSNPALDYPHPRSEAVQGQPPIMFSSTTSDFVTFRPDKPLRVTCLTIGSRGDVQPYIALCKGLMAQGHKCKIASHGEYRKWVEGHGIEFSAVGGDPAELMQLMISHDFFTISFMKEAIGKFRGWLDDLLDSAWEGCQNSDVLIESPSAIAGYHIAEALRIPYYRAFTMPWSRTRAYPHAFAVPEIKMGGGYNYMTYTMFDQVFWRATSGQVNRWRKDTLKVRATNLDAMQQHKIPFLYNFSPVVIPPPLDWRENIHVTGYWILENPGDSDSGDKWGPPEDLIEWMDKAKAEEKKIVFIGFGSIIIPDPVAMTRVISEAVEEAGVYAIVAKGWSDRAGSKDDSEEEKKKTEEKEKEQHELLDRPFIYNVKSIPHDWLFGRIDAAVHHGGAGTTGASLRAGLPTIIKPFFGDQHFYADRVATLGIGTHLHDFKTKEVTEALVTATTDEKQIERARQAGEDIRKEDGVATAIECIYRDLEYARSLIPSPTDVEKEIGDSSHDLDEDADDIAKGLAKDLDRADRLSAKEAKSDAGSIRSIVGSVKGRKEGKKHKNDEEEEEESPSSSSNSESRRVREGERTQEGSRTASSSDEGWEVMSRGSTTGESAVSVSRGSSATRSRQESASASPADREHAGEEGKEGSSGGGLTAKVLSMLGKPVSHSSSSK